MRIFFCCVLFVACTSKTNLTTDIDELYAAIPKDSLKELLSYSGFPDSTLTESQLETKKKMILLLEEYLTVVDNQFVLLAKPEDFEKQDCQSTTIQFCKKNIEMLTITLILWA